MNEQKLTYNVSEVAKLLGLSRNSVYQACERGEIPCLRFGKRILVPKVQLERMLAGMAAQEVNSGQRVANGES